MKYSVQVEGEPAVEELEKEMERLITERGSYTSLEAFGGICAKEISEVDTKLWAVYNKLPRDIQKKYRND